MITDKVRTIFWRRESGWVDSMRNIATRRESLLVASLGGVAAAAGAISATAQDNNSLGLDAKRSFHTAQLVDRVNANNSVAALSRDGMLC